MLDVLNKEIVWSVWTPHLERHIFTESDTITHSKVVVNFFNNLYNLTFWCKIDRIPPVRFKRLVFLTEKLALIFPESRCTSGRRETMKRYLNRLSLNRRLISPQRRKVLRGFETAANHFEYLNSVRSGSKISRFFRHIFEYKHVKRILGSNLALLMVITAFAPQPSIIAQEASETVVYSAPEDHINTEITVRDPLAEIQVNQGYYFFHPGVDLEGVTGDPINPIMNGHVEYVQYSKYDYGNAVLIDHENGYKSLYAHLSKIEVAVGQSVNVFDEIGLVGSTGHSTGDHLHLEVYENGKTINPLSILPRD